MGREGDEPPQVVTVDGVTVEKHLNRDDPSRVAVSFEIQSDRPDPVRIRLQDPVPTQFPVGFHPDFGGEHWSRTDHGAVFERDLEGDETCRTAYGLGNVSEGDMSQLAAEPSIEVSPQTEESQEPAVAADTNEGEETDPIGNLGDLDLSIGISEELDLGESVFDDADPQSSATNQIDGAGESPAEAAEPASGSSMDNEGFEAVEEEFPEAALEDDQDMAAESSSGVGETEATGPDGSVEADPGQFKSTAEIATDPLDSYSPPLEESKAGGQSTTETQPQSSGWISAQMKQTIEDLEAATTDLAAASTARTTTLAELQGEVQTLSEEFAAIKGSLASLEDQSSHLMAVFEDLEASGRSFESVIEDREGPAEPEVAELHSTIADIDEELSGIKSSLASNLETAFQHETDLEAVDTQLDRIGHTVETIADRNQEISDELVSLRELHRSNSETLSALKTEQAALRDMANTTDTRLAELADRVDDIADSIETAD
jgi:predicted  nucleic acid-binding Zn-ribbon protein